MIDPEGFIHLNREEMQDVFEIGVVTSVSGGKVKITFDGELKPSNKFYMCLTSYRPIEDDTVLLARVSDTYVVVGKLER